MPFSTSSRTVFVSLLAVLVLVVMIISYWSPLTSDTFHHALSGLSHEFSVSLIWERCIQSYLTWNPRVGEYLAFIFATAGKGYFVCFNPFVILTLSLLMFYMIKGYWCKGESWADVSLWGLGTLLLLVSTARPGVTLYWLSGATNYSWAATLWLGFLCFYRRFFDANTPKPLSFLGSCSLVFLGFLAGMTNENNIPATWLLLGGLFFYCRLIKRQHLPYWFYAGGIAHILGALCFLFAPGISARMNSESPGCAEPISGIAECLESIPSLMLKMHTYLVIAFFLSVSLIFYFIKSKNWNWNSSILRLSTVFFITSYFMALVFCVAVEPASHAMFSSTLMFILGTMGLLVYWQQTSHSSLFSSKGIRFSCFIMLGLLALTMYDHFCLYQQFAWRHEFILKQKEAGELHILVPPLEPMAPWNAYIYWCDIDSDPNGYVSQGAAKYYGVKTITTAPIVPSL